MIHLLEDELDPAARALPREIDRLEIHEVAFEPGVCPNVSQLEGGKEAFKSKQDSAAEGVHGWRPPFERNRR